MSAGWSLGALRGYLGQNPNILLENHRELEIKMHNYFIVISVLNPDKSYDKCHGLPFLMPQTWFEHSIDNFGAKTADF
jgi:hypothetical protein